MVIVCKEDIRFRRGVQFLQQTVNKMLQHQKLPLQRILYSIMLQSATELLGGRQSAN